MPTELVLRQEGPAPKDAPLTNKEIDENFLLLEARQQVSEQRSADYALVMAIALGG